MALPAKGLTSSQVTTHQSTLPSPSSLSIMIVRECVCVCRNNNVVKIPAGAPPVAVAVLLTLKSERSSVHNTGSDNREQQQQITCRYYKTRTAFYGNDRWQNKALSDVMRHVSSCLCVCAHMCQDAEAQGCFIISNDRQAMIMPHHSF